MKLPYHPGAFKFIQIHGKLKAYAARMLKIIDHGADVFILAEIKGGEKHGLFIFMYFYFVLSHLSLSRSCCAQRVMSKV